MLSFQKNIRMQKVVIMRKHPPFKIKDKKEERASHVTCINGSICLEAAMVLPLFIAAVVAVIFFIQAVQIEMRLQKALYNQIMKTSGIAYYVNVVDLSDTVEQMLEAEYVKNEVIKEAGKDFLDNSYIDGGHKGIKVDLLCKAKEGILDVKLIYYMSVPFNLFGIKPVRFETHMVNHTWIGKTENDSGTNAEMVYVTASGQVYHLYKDCSYISSTIQSCKETEIELKRNSSGSKYLPCKICGSDSDTGKVYYTKYGTRYHKQANCRNLYSSIYAIDIETAKSNYRLCSKCEKRR